jgi:KDO2-lipid IV(A) lauroyltransferase
MEFFGRPAPIPLGTAAIALKLGTPLLPVCVYRLPDDTFMAEAAPHVLAESTGDKRADEIRVTQELLRHIEGFIRRHPEQWHVPHRIWQGSR